jgi:hypothetical protein
MCHHPSTGLLNLSTDMEADQILVRWPWSSICLLLGVSFLKLLADFKLVGVCNSWQPVNSFEGVKVIELRQNDYACEFRD